MSSPERTPVRARREPPRFRRVVVRHVEQVGPRMVRVSLAGPELEGLTVEHPAASVRLLLPSPGERELVMPQWNGNEFLLPDGRRPAIRTFTPLAAGSVTELDLMIVLHGSGVASQWAESVRPGNEAAVSGPGRGYAIDPDAPAYLLVGDETAIPAVSQLLEALPAGTPVKVHIELSHPDARLAPVLGGQPLATVEWWDLTPGAPAGDAMVAAVRATGIVPGTRVWAAGEAAAVQRIRRDLFEERGLSRSQATVRGYWKYGRGGDTDDDG